VKRLIPLILDTLEKGLTVVNHLVARALWHLRHPSWRGAAKACAALPLLLVL